MVGTFQSLGIKVDAIELVLASVPIALIVLVLVWLNNIRFDKYLDKKYDSKQVKRDE